MARKLIVEILGDSKSLERSFTRSSAAANKFGRDVDTGVGRAEARFSKLQKVAAGGFVGGLIANEAIAGIKSVVTAAAESQQVLGQTRVALEATGNSWETYGRQIQDTIRVQSKLGFDDEALLRTFSLFVRTTDDVGESLRLNNLAMDVARARFIDLEQAALLVNKAAIGQAGALRRLGIDVKNGASAQELLTALTEKYGGAAQKSSKDATTALDRVAVSTENLKESVGTILLPAVTLLAEDLAAVADTAALAVTGLQRLGDVRIPEIEIPFNITVGGQSVGGAAKRGAGLLKFTPINPLFFATVVAGIATQFRDQAEAATPSLANEFARSIDTLITNALDTAAGQTSVTPPKVKGFGTGLKPSDLFGPKITGIPKALQERLLDAELAGKGIRETLAKQRDILVKALDDPRNNRDDRIKIKTALKGVKAQIAAIDADVAAGIKSANDARTARLKQTAEDAKAKAAKHKEQLKQIAAHQAEVAKAAREAARAAVQSAQFRAIGLSPEGGERIPTVQNLQKQLGQVADKDVSLKVRKQLSNVAKVLRGDFGKVTEQTRAAIKELFSTIRGTFDEESGKLAGPLTKTSSLNVGKILDGLGLGRDTEKELRARLSSFNSAGKALAGSTRPTGAFATGSAAAGDVVIHVTTTLDGAVVAQNTTKHQQKTRRRNPKQKRGPNRGV